MEKGFNTGRNDEVHLYKKRYEENMRNDPKVARDQRGVLLISSLEIPSKVLDCRSLVFTTRIQYL